jgi:hypothetical protein
MRLSRRQLLRGGVLLPSLLLPPTLGAATCAALAEPLPQADLNHLDGEDVVFAHISDTHMRPTDPEGVQHLRTLLTRIRAANPAFLLDTGDLADDNTGASLSSYLTAVDQAGGYSRYPTYAPGIPLIAVAGNHDYCGVVYEKGGVLQGSPFPEYMGPPPPYPYLPIAPTRHSFTVGNYRFVGTSGHPDWLETWPQTWLERQLELSCADGRSAVLFHHHCYNGWMGDAHELEISPEGSTRIDTLAQRYPVLAYLCGHCHYERLEAMPPGYVAHAVARSVLRDRSSGIATGPGPFALCALAEGHINFNIVPNDHVSDVFVVVTRPAQYLETQFRDGPLKRLEQSKTLAGPTKVRAYARAKRGTITRADYQLDDGPRRPMQRLGTSAYWEATFDASALSGIHTLRVIAKADIGGWEPEAAHQITCCFADSVPTRPTAACGSRRLVQPLAAGWNLISLPFIPTRPAITDALQSIQGAYTDVLAYDAAAAAWLRYSPSVPAQFNTLSTLAPQRGYWLHMSRPATLYVSGEPLTPANIALRPGWNLVGFPSAAAQPISQALASIAGQYDCVYAYDSTMASGEWRTYIVGEVSSDLESLEPGQGYWIYAKTNCTWICP